MHPFAAVLVLGALLAAPAAVQFARSESPIPLAALQLAYHDSLDAWVFVDRWAVPYHRMFVLLCVGPVTTSLRCASRHVPRAEVRFSARASRAALRRTRHDLVEVRFLARASLCRRTPCACRPR